ncbi:MAG TPA: thioesterase [Spirochaetia bacterium]|nr:MAG: hypothetical protein A2Y41_10170 [Spirochaetes bacterium GWB1_36_13]HCL55706.1 thioesterase [Spirochaetia bacterium]
MLPENFSFFLPYTVSIKDINYGGHVGNDVFLSYFQEARIAYLQHLGFSELNIGGNGLILVKAEVEYKAELFHKDPVKLFAGITEMKNSSFIMDYLIVKEGEIIAATGKTVLVSFDYQERKVKKIPVDFRNRVKEFETSKNF